MSLEKFSEMFVYQLVKWASEERGDTSSTPQVSSPSEPPIDHELQQRFDSAAAFVRTVTDRISQLDLLYLYARYKQATVGKADPDDRPGIFDWKGREKFDSWFALGSLPREDAMHEYIKKVFELNLGWQPSKKYPSGFGVRPSTLASANSDDDIEGPSGLRSDVIEWFSAISAGNMGRVLEMLKANKELLVERDENQVTALHHAADRGNVELIECLLEAGADVSIQDYDGQTPLHYAVSCSHQDAVRSLLKHGADPTIADFEGNCVLDTVTDATIRKWLEEANPEAPS
uniref:Acyl-CoA-binding domain-containing protein 6 n=2 Tax=Parascaris univalens TaxID=6257 RepID=A0A915BY06_PARUN